MKHAVCPINPNHKIFERPVEVKGRGRELVDEDLQVIEVEPPLEFYLLRRYSELVCAIDKSQAKIYLPVRS